MKHQADKNGRQPAEKPAQGFRLAGVLDPQSGHALVFRRGIPIKVNGVSPDNHALAKRPSNEEPVPGRKKAAPRTTEGGRNDGMMLFLYRLVSDGGAPLIRLYLGLRKARGKEDKTRFGERLGFPGRERPAGALCWAHAASVGESLSLLPLIARLIAERPGLNVLRLALPHGAAHRRFAPWSRR